MIGRCSLLSTAAQAFESMPAWKHISYFSIFRRLSNRRRL